jgi:hypothetical protein
MTLSELFDISLVQKRDQPALEGDRSYTFGEIDSRATHSQFRFVTYPDHNLAHVTLFGATETMPIKGRRP